jgi:hydrogenase/urease accessory protein HupE
MVVNPSGGRLLAIGLQANPEKGRRTFMLLSVAITALVILGLLLSMLSSSPRMDR